MKLQMSDLVLNINLDESKKKNRLIMETYEGTIPNLKSKKYSGQLRNVNINAKYTFNNISDKDVQIIRAFLNDEFNVQITKYQYLIAPKNITGIADLEKIGCLFYKEKKTGMFQIEFVKYEEAPSKNMYSIEGLRVGGEKTALYLVKDDSKIEIKVKEIIPKAYINLGKKEFPLVLKFDYGNSIVDFFSEERQLESKGTYRDFGFENRIRKGIEASGWKLKRNEGFIFIGKNINKCIYGLIEKGVSVYTNSEKKVSMADFSNIKISYDLDWFSIKGRVLIDDDSVDISELIDFKKKRENWVEYNGQVIILPTALSSKKIEKDSGTGELHIDKKYIPSAIGVAYDLNKGSVHNLDRLIGYNEISINIDPHIQKILRAYQIIGVKWLLSLRKNGFGACLADDMGLGKTLQIIAFLSDESLNKTRNLIIVPKTLLLNWKREIRKFSPNTSMYLYHGRNRNIDDLANAKIVISTYQTILNDKALFENISFDNLIIDEAQYIKNSGGKTYNAIKSIKASMKIILTGTPIENNLAEFWGLMRLINPSIIEPYRSVSKDSTRLVDKIKRLTAPFLLRRMKKDVLKDLPAKQEQTILINMDEEQQRIYDKILKSIQYELLRKNDRFEMRSNSILLSGLLYLQEICCHPQLLPMEYSDGVTKSAKLDTLMELLKPLYLNGHKVVVFSRFTKMLALIEKSIILEHMNYYYLDGSTQNRMGVVDAFEKSDNGIFLISLKAGGTGLNLISADTAVIYDPWWNPSSEKQAEDRIYRIGQKRNVLIYKLIMEGTIEEKIQKLQAEKMSLCSEILDGHDVSLSMTAEIMEKLILE